VLSQYFCDLGYVVKGTNKTKKIKVQNSTGQPVSFSVDKKMMPAGVSVEPEYVNKLAEFDSIELALTLQTGGLAPGKLNVSFNIDMKNGPLVQLNLSAHVQQPEIEVSAHNLNFGRVQVGHCKCITVQLTNPNDVPADWIVRKPMEKVQDWNFFRCVPSGGTLHPGQKLNMRVFFEPAAVRSEYRQDIPLKIVSNKKEVRFTCLGEAYHLTLRPEPAVVDLQPILPNTEEPNQAFFSLWNDSEVAIEVVSLDFDQGFLEDDEVTAYADGFDDQDRMLLPPLEAGKGLWPHLVEANLARKAALQAIADAEGAARLVEEERERRKAEGIEDDPEPEEEEPKAPQV
jgi:hypothetical protein